MLTSETLNYILAVIALGTVAFSIWNQVKKPQDDLELKQAVSGKDLESKASVLAAKEMENKAALLDQQVKLERELNEKKFIEMGVNIKEAFALAQNHVHTLDTKMDVMTNNLNSLTLRVERLAVILEERLPSKK